MPASTTQVNNRNPTTILVSAEHRLPLRMSARSREIPDQYGNSRQDCACQSHHGIRQSEELQGIRSSSPFRKWGRQISRVAKPGGRRAALTRARTEQTWSGGRVL